MEPNKKNIRKWVKALRSGEYRQTKNRLGSRGRYCCLGVACEVAIKSGIVVQKEQGKDYGYDGSTASLPKSVWAWLGVESDPMLVGSDGCHECASGWNDTHKAKFDKIADMIHATFLKKEIA